jgi:hypothetical protein
MLWLYIERIDLLNRFGVLVPFITFKEEIKKKNNIPKMRQHAFKTRLQAKAFLPSCCLNTSVSCQSMSTSTYLQDVSVIRQEMISSPISQVLTVAKNSIN